MEAEDFIKDVLVNRFRVKYIVVGTDFRFGHEKRGDYHMLQSYAGKYGYEVEVIEKKVYQGREISSTFIKEELQKGNVELVNTLLGYEYSKK
jgi:riboflavin kinase/FMN adenylyltransferase